MSSVYDLDFWKQAMSNQKVASAETLLNNSLHFENDISESENNKYAWLDLIEAFISAAVCIHSVL